MARESFASMAARAVYEDGLVIIDGEAWTVAEWELKAKRAAYQAAYAQRPEVKARKAAYAQRPEVKARKAAYAQRPEVKAKQAAYRADIRRLARLARAAGLGR